MARTPDQLTTPNAPTRFFFLSGQRNYTRAEIDQMIATNGRNIIVGQHVMSDQSPLVHAKSNGARVHWYMLGAGEPEGGYNGNGVRFPSDQKEIREHIDEMNQLASQYSRNPSGFSPDMRELVAQISRRKVTRSDWDNGDWLLWHKMKFIEARDEEVLAKKEGRTPKKVLPDTAEFDSLNNAAPERVANIIADFSQWRASKGIKTQITAKNLERPHIGPIEAAIKDGRIKPGVFAPIYILEEYASPQHVREISEWANRNGGIVVKTVNTDDYRSPDGGYALPQTLAWNTFIGQYVDFSNFTNARAITRTWHGNEPTLQVAAVAPENRGDIGAVAKLEDVAGARLILAGLAAKETKGPQPDDPRIRDFVPAAKAGPEQLTA